MILNANDIKRMARDASEEAVKSAMNEAARAQRLRNRLEPMIGKVPEAHVMPDEIGKYGLTKLHQQLPDDGNHGEALEYFLAGCFSGRGTGSGMDCAGESFLDNYIAA